MPVKSYRVRLSREEREFLNEIVKTGKCEDRKVIRAKVLLHADEGPDGLWKSDTKIKEKPGQHAIRFQR